MLSFRRRVKRKGCPERSSVEFVVPYVVTHSSYKRANLARSAANLVENSFQGSYGPEYPSYVPPAAATVSVLPCPVGVPIVPLKIDRQVIYFIRILFIGVGVRYIHSSRSRWIFSLIENFLNSWNSWNAWIFFFFNLLLLDYAGNENELNYKQM